MRLSEAARLLGEAGIDSPREEARRLFSHFGNIPLHSLIACDCESDAPQLLHAIERRCAREPLQYIIGEVAFYRERYEVSPDCLIPREDTEVLVDYAVGRLREGARILDLCCGSGCIAISCVANTVGTSAVAADISAAALDIARRNISHNNVGGRVELLRLDVLREMPDTGEKFDAILSNPPYIADSVYLTLEREIFHEPRCAFVGGDDGGDFYRAITPRYKSLLAEGGFIAYEIGYDQSELIRSVAADCDMSVEIICDLSGNPRVAVLEP